MRKTAILFATCLVLASCARQGATFFDGLVDIGTHSLQFRSEGTGFPVVVIDAGLGDSLDKLKPLQARIGRVTRVVTFNRAGYGRSEAGPMPRDGRREAEELKALLTKAKVPGPWVLVGHSLGGLNAQVFAASHPGDVAGLVLLDPPPLSFLLGQDYRDLMAMAVRMTAEWQSIADAAAKSADPGERARGAFFRMLASEHREMFGETARQAESISTFGAIPLLVMAAGKPNPAFGAEAEQYQKYWIGQSRVLAAKSTKGRFVLAPGSSHYLYLDAPDLVEKSIITLVREVRAGISSGGGK